MSVLSYHVVCTLKCKQNDSREGLPAPPPPPRGSGGGGEGRGERGGEVRRGWWTGTLTLTLHMTAQGPAYLRAGRLAEGGGERGAGGGGGCRRVAVGKPRQCLEMYCLDNNTQFSRTERVVVGLPCAH